MAFLTGRLRLKILKALAVFVSVWSMVYQLWQQQKCILWTTGSLAPELPFHWLGCGFPRLHYLHMYSLLLSCDVLNTVICSILAVSSYKCSNHINHSNCRVIWIKLLIVWPSADQMLQNITNHCKLARTDRKWITSFLMRMIWSGHHWSSQMGQSKPCQCLVTLVSWCTYNCQRF